jgi:hypothetical protein
MEVSPSLLFSIGSLVGTMITGFLTIGYWMLKVRKDLNEAHKAIRSIKERKKR